MSYPRKYPTGVGDNHCEPADWNAMVDRINGFSPEGMFISSYKFLVCTNEVEGTTYYYGCNAFQIIYGGPENAGGVNGTNARAVTQACLNNLTADRTWKEKVILIGDFIIDNVIWVDDYTEFELIGTITLADNAAEYMTAAGMIRNVNATVEGDPDLEDPNTNIEVYGGVWDGNKANQPELTPVNAYFMCYFRKVNDLSVHDLTAQNMLSDGIHIRIDCNNVKTYNIITHDNGENGLIVLECTNLLLSMIHTYNNGGNGIMIGHSANDITENVIVTDLHTHHNTQNGFFVDNTKNLKLFAQSHDNGYSGNTVNGSQDIFIYAELYKNTNGISLIDCDGVTILGLVHDNTLMGIELETVTNTTVDLVSYNNEQTGLSTRMDCKYLTVKGRYFNNGMSGIVIDDTDNFQITALAFNNNQGAHPDIHYKCGIAISSPTGGAVETYGVISNFGAFDDQGIPTQHTGVFLGTNSSHIVVANGYVYGNTGDQLNDSGVGNVVDADTIDGYP